MTQLVLPLVTPPTLPVVVEPYDPASEIDLQVWRAALLERVLAALPPDQRARFQVDVDDCPGWAFEVAQREHWVTLPRALPNTSGSR